MNILQVIKDVLTPGTPAHMATLERMRVIDLNLARNLLMLNEPFIHSILAATDQAAEFSDDRNY